MRIMREGGTGTETETESGRRKGARGRKERA